MKKAVLLGVALAASTSLYAQTIAQWTFESSFANITGTGMTLGGLNPETGTGTASGVHASASTAWSSPAGNGSAHSFSANTWGVGDYYQFQTSTLGFQNIGVSYDQTSSGTGPGRFDFAYSTDGIAFTTISASYIVNSNAAPNPTWNSTTYSSIYLYYYDLSAVTALNNASTVYFRLTDSSTTSSGGGTVATAGTDRVDNFTVGVVPLPEPQTITFLAGGFGLLAWRWLRRKK